MALLNVPVPPGHRVLGVLTINPQGQANINAGVPPDALLQILLDLAKAVAAQLAVPEQPKVLVPKLLVTGFEKARDVGASNGASAEPVPAVEPPPDGKVVS